MLGVNNETGVFLNETLLGAEIKQANYRVKPGEFCYNPYRINVGSIGLNEFDYDNQIISGAYVIFGTNESELHPKFLGALFKSAQFLAYVNERASGGVRMNFRFEHLEDWEISLPSIDSQMCIVDEIDKLQKMAMGAELIADHFQIEVPELLDYEPQPLATVIAEIQNGLYKPGSDYGTGTPILRINDFGTGDTLTNLAELKVVRLAKDEAARFAIECNDIVLNRVNSLEHVGKVALVGEIQCACVYESNMMRLRVDTTRVLPTFVFRWLASPRVAAKLKAKAKQAVNQFSVNQGDVGELLIPVPPLAEQSRIVAELDAKMKLLSDLRAMREEAERAIRLTLDRIWEA